MLLNRRTFLVTSAGASLRHAFAQLAPQPPDDAPVYQRGEIPANFFHDLDTWMAQHQENKPALKLAVNEVARSGFKVLKAYYTFCMVDASSAPNLPKTADPQALELLKLDAFTNRQLIFLTLNDSTQRLVQTVSRGLAIAYDLKDEEDQPVTPGRSFSNRFFKNTIPTDIPEAKTHHDLFDTLQTVSGKLDQNAKDLKELSGQPGTTIEDRSSEIRGLYREFDRNVVKPLENNVNKLPPAPRPSLRAPERHIALNLPASPTLSNERRAL